MEKINEKKISINGLEINYKVLGKGDPFLILHGWGGSSDSWIKTQKILAKKGYKVISLDWPGFGKSITPPKPWGVKDYSNFLLNFIKELKLKKVILLGHSFGGRIAIKFASKRPDKLKRLILCCSAGIKTKPGFKTKVIFKVARIGNAVFSPKILVRLKDRARNLFYVFLRRKDYVKADGTMKETIKKVLAEDLYPNLSRIKTRTLIVWGERDKMVPVKTAYIFKEKIPKAQLHILSKIGHSPHLENPKRLSEIIITFLKSKKK